MPDKPPLYICHIDDGAPPPHPCRRSQRALRDAGHDFEKVVFGKGIPFGLFTKGRRPDLKEMSGQEKLPVLALPDGSTVNGSAAIIEWAKANAPAQRSEVAEQAGERSRKSPAPATASGRGPRASRAPRPRASTHTSRGQPGPPARPHRRL